jgi:hypothetical protein
LNDLDGEQLARVDSHEFHGQFRSVLSARRCDGGGGPRRQLERLAGRPLHVMTDRKCGRLENKLPECDNLFAVQAISDMPCKLEMSAGDSEIQNLPTPTSDSPSGFVSALGCDAQASM